MKQRKGKDKPLLFYQKTSFIEQASVTAKWQGRKRLWQESSITGCIHNFGMPLNRCH